ncbi:hypothetical protein L2E82_10522 [Cichorium intybus]|uniref:Uncharacterized protein n=1 Tax=Cichorium intybus TaxID=13427 RepID=A0ACB9GAL4_CICIN|nr:hypothetical protein L2E82_10522 [Cichorium intybus]
MDILISLEPSNMVVIRIENGHKCSGELNLKNVMYTMPIAFRLKPVNKTRYTVKPHSGIISPLTTLTEKIKGIYLKPAEHLSLPILASSRAFTSNNEISRLLNISRSISIGSRREGNRVCSQKISFGGKKLFARAALFERDNDGEVKRQPPSKKVFNGDSGIRRQNVSFAEAVKGSRISKKDSVEGNVTESNMVRHFALKSVAIHESETLEKIEYLKEKLIGEDRIKEVEPQPVGDNNGRNESFSDNKEIVEKESSEEDDDDWFQTSDEESVVRCTEGEFEESDGDSRIEESLFDSPSKTTHAGTVNIELSDEEVRLVKPDSVQMVNAVDNAVDTPNSPKKAVNDAGGNYNHSTSREGEKIDSENVGNMGNAFVGDQGRMFGSATVEPSQLTPLGHVRATKIEAELTEVRNSATCASLFGSEKSDCLRKEAKLNIWGKGRDLGNAFEEWQRSERLPHFAVVRGGSYEMIFVFLFCEHSTKRKINGGIRACRILVTKVLVRRQIRVVEEERVAGA